MQYRTALAILAATVANAAPTSPTLSTAGGVNSLTIPLINGVGTISGSGGSLLGVSANPSGLTITLGGSNQGTGSITTGSTGTVGTTTSSGVGTTVGTVVGDAGKTINGAANSLTGGALGNTVGDAVGAVGTALDGVTNEVGDVLTDLGKGVTNLINPRDVAATNAVEESPLQAFVALLNSIIAEV